MKILELIESKTSLKKVELLTELAKLHIDIIQHPDGRMILNYDQINSPKYNEIVRECRALVLDEDFNLVSRSFKRFFNIGESDDVIDYSESISYDKEDGSLINCYYWDGLWRTNTRGSFGESYVNNSEYTWSDLVKSCINFSHLDKHLSYNFELCSPYNKIVRIYGKTQVKLLSIFAGPFELSHDDCVKEAKQSKLDMVSFRIFKNSDEIIKYIENVSENDATYEGIVCRDKNNNRTKIKSVKYLHLHRLHNNRNIVSPKNLVPLIMMGETDEVIVYFPELKTAVEKYKEKIDAVTKEIEDTWYCYHDIDNKKKFALSITKSTKFTAPLFMAKNYGGHPRDYLTSEYLLKNCFN